MEKELFWGCLMAVSFMKMEEVAKIMGVPMEEVYKKVEEMMELLKLVSKVDCINLFFFPFLSWTTVILQPPSARVVVTGVWRRREWRLEVRMQMLNAFQLLYVE